MFEGGNDNHNGVKNTVIGELSTGVTEGNTKITPLMKYLGGVFAWKPEDDKRLASIMSTSKDDICDKDIWSSVAERMGGGKS